MATANISSSSLRLQSDAVPSATQVKGAAPHAAAKPVKGYSIDIFSKDTHANKFLCVHCKNVLRIPLQSDCGHRFCQDCMDEIASMEGPVRCAACEAEECDPDDIDDPDRGVLDFTCMFSDKAAIREMKKLETKCPNQQCKWTGQFQKYQEHENMCEFRLVVCDLCARSVAFGKLDRHKKSECVKREVKCRNCRHKMTFDQEEKHIGKCPNAPVKCDSCPKLVPRNDMEMHKLTDCANREMTCPVQDCNTTLARHQFHPHFLKNNDTQSKHMLYLFDKISQLTSEIERLETEQVARGGAAGETGMSPDSTLEIGAVGGQEAEAGAQTLPADVKQKLKLHEDLMSVLHGEILRCIQQIEALSKELELNKKYVVDGNLRVQALLTKVDGLEEKLNEMRTTMNTPVGFGSIINSNDGSAFWKIPDFVQVRQQAINESQVAINSPSFYTHPLGYRMRLRMFPNGDGAAKGTAISLFVQMQKGEADDLLVWPFLARVYLMLIDQKDFRNHRVENFQTTPNLTAFQKPTGDNSGSGCQTFVTQTTLGENYGTFVANDSIYVKVVVDLDQSVKQRLDNLGPHRR